MAQYKTFKTMVSDEENPTNSNLSNSELGQAQNVQTIKRITSEKHRDELIKNNKILVIDNYADWCGPCKQIEPQVLNLATKYSRPGLCVFAKENVDDQLDGIPTPIRGVPCFHIYVSGKFLDNEVIMGGELGKLEELIKRFY